MSVLHLKTSLTILFLFFSLRLFAQPEKLSGMLFLCGQDQPVIGEFQVYKKTGVILKGKKFYQKKKYTQFVSDDETIVIEGNCLDQETSSISSSISNQSNSTYTLDENTARRLLSKNLRDQLAEKTEGGIELDKIELTKMTSESNNKKKIVANIHMKTTKDIILAGRSGDSPCIPCYSVTKYLNFDLSTKEGKNNFLRTYFIATKNTMLTFTGNTSFEFNELKNSWDITPIMSQGLGYSSPNLIILNPIQKSNQARINQVITGRNMATSNRKRSVVEPGEPVNNSSNQSVVTQREPYKKPLNRTTKPNIAYSKGCKPSINKIDKLSGQTIEGFGGAIIKAPAIGDKRVSLLLHLVQAKNNDGTGDIFLLATYDDFLTSDQYAIANNMYLQNTSNSKFSIRLNGEILEFKPANVTPNVKDILGGYLISVKMAALITKEQIQVLQSKNIEYIRYTVGGKMFDGTLKKSKNADKIRRNFSCIDANLIKNKEIKEAIREPNLSVVEKHKYSKTIMGRWKLTLGATNVFFVFKDKGVLNLQMNGQNSVGTYNVIGNQFIYSYNINGKQDSGADKISIFTQDMIVLDSKDGQQTLTRIQN